jgi:hypothetical protein
LQAGFVLPASRSFGIGISSFDILKPAMWREVLEAFLEVELSAGRRAALATMRAVRKPGPPPRHRRSRGGSSGWPIPLDELGSI